MNTDSFYVAVSSMKVSLATLRRHWDEEDWIRLLDHHVPDGEMYCRDLFKI